jgi:arylsulfatase
MVTIGDEMKKLGATYVKYPPRPQQSESYSGPITLSAYERFSHIREALAKEGVNVPMPTGN